MRRIDDQVDRRSDGAAPVRADDGDTRNEAHSGGGQWMAGIAGVAGPVGFTLTFLVLEQVRRGEFSPVRLPVSALEAGPYGWVQQLSFVGFGLLTLFFAVGLHRGMRPSRWGAAGPALLALSGLGLLLAAAFPLQQDGAGMIYDPGGHAVAGTLFFGTSALGLVVLCLRMAHDPAWRGLVRWTLAAGIACTAAFILMPLLAIPENAPLHEWAGLLQRATILLALFPARVALSRRLLQRGRG